MNKKRKGCYELNFAEFCHLINKIFPQRGSDPAEISFPPYALMLKIMFF